MAISIIANSFVPSMANELNAISAKELNDTFKLNELYRVYCELKIALYTNCNFKK